MLLLLLALTASAADWERHESPRRVTLTRAADAPVTGWRGRTERPELVIACEGRRVRAWVHTGLPVEVYGDFHDEFLASAHLGLDDAPLEPHKLRRGVVPDELHFRRARRVVAGWLGRDALTVGFTPSNASPVQARFSLAGLRDATTGTCRL